LKIRDGGSRHLLNHKIAISQQLFDRSLQPFDRFDDIWHNDVYWSPTAERPFKFRIFENSRWRQPASEKSQKSLYLRNGLTDHYQIWYIGAKWVY